VCTLAFTFQRQYTDDSGSYRTRNTYGQISKLEHGNVEPDKLGSFHHEGSGAATSAARLDPVDTEPKSDANV